MRRICMFTLVLATAFAGTEVVSAQESMAAKTTRKKLQKTIEEVDLKDVGTKDFLDEALGDIEVKVIIDNASGVSNNTKMTYKAKNITGEKLLNDLADKYDWGWYVVSEASNNKIDGKVKIRKSSKGKERGYEAGKEPKKTSLDFEERFDRAFGAKLFFTSAQATDADAAKKDLDRFQGEWVIGALEVNGQDVSADKLVGTALTVKGDEYSVKVKDTTIRCKLTLDPAKDPKEIDMLFLDGANKDKTQKGIYRFKDETFQISRGIDPAQNRPREFATWPDTNYFVVTWKKK